MVVTIDSTVSEDFCDNSEIIIQSKSEIPYEELPQEEGNLSVVLQRKGHLTLVHRDMPPAPGPNEVTLRMLRVGICGSDVHMWQKGEIAGFFQQSPHVLGHEGCAQVIAMGTNVNKLTKGDIVSIEPQVPCWDSCDDCRSGRYNLCHKVTFHGCPPQSGSLSKFINHDARSCHKLPDDVSPEEGALMEPLSVGVYACMRGKVTVGQTVLILGSGPIGLVTLMTAKASGASHVCIIDLNMDRLETAEEIGADSVIHMTKEDMDWPMKLADKVRQVIGQSPDVTIDCVGDEAAVNAGIHATKRGGILVLVGCASLEVRIPLQVMKRKEIDVVGVFRYRNTWPLCLQMVREKKVDVKRLITHRFQLVDFMTGIRMAQSGKGIKVMIDME